MARRKRILVVDDEPNVAMMIQSRLENENYDVIKAQDGLEALEKVRSEQPDLILLDILMPRMDGCEFLEQMKVQGLMKNIPIIVLTAKASMREFFLVEGVAEFLVKPFNSRHLLGEIARHLAEVTDGVPPASP